MAHRGTVDVLLFGRDPVRSTRLLFVAAVLFVVSLFAHLPVRYLGPVSVTGPTILALVFTTMFLVAAAGAYVNGGLLVAVALAAGVGIGFYAPVVLFDLANLGDATLWVLAVGNVSAVVTGVLGFAAGAGGHRLLR